MNTHSAQRFPIGLALALAFLAGAARTVVAQPELRLRIASRTPSAATLELTGPAPGTYRIEWSDNLQAWQPLGTNVLASDRLTITDPTNRLYRFYRAVLLADPPYAPGEVLLSFRAAAEPAAMDDLLTAMDLHIMDYILTPAMEASGSTAVLRLDSAMPVSEAVAALRASPMVEFAEPNYLVSHMATADDPSVTDGYMWGLYGDVGSPANVFGSQAAEAWAAGYTGSRQVYVGVIDQGIDISHPDLAPNIWTNPFEIPGNGIDDDGNGYADDLHGWDFYFKDNSVFDGSPATPDVDEHGTHVAGTIGAVGGNTLGVAGVNWQVTLISGKFLGPSSGSTSDAIEAIDYFTDLKRRHGLNIVALNNSWGGGAYSVALQAAIARAAQVNILFIAAAGNSARNNDIAPFYPANYDTRGGAGYDSVISVAALSSAGSLASFSHYGATTVDLAAPGVSILSTAPSGQFRYLSGTSMATPHVTGAAALYASTHPRATAADIRAAVLDSTTATPALAGKCVTGGRLDLSAVVTPTPFYIYVDAAYSSGVPDGTPERPFPTVTQGLAAAQRGDSLRIRANTYRERPPLDKAVRLELWGSGTVRLGP